MKNGRIVTKNVFQHFEKSALDYKGHIKLKKTKVVISCFENKCNKFERISLTFCHYVLLRFLNSFTTIVILRM